MEEMRAHLGVCRRLLWSAHLAQLPEQNWRRMRAWVRRFARDDFKQKMRRAYADQETHAESGRSECRSQLEVLPRGVGSGDGNDGSGAGSVCVWIGDKWNCGS